MADVTINELTSQAPTTSDLFPFATAVSPSTYKASLAQIKTALAISWSDVSDKPSFATVATTGSYTDLSNKPTIPTNTGIGGAQYFTAATTSWVVPAGITKIKVYCIGAGGNGGANDHCSAGGDSYITNISIVGGGGAGNGGGAGTGAGGVGSGTLAIVTRTGSSGSSNTAATAAQAAMIFGSSVGYGGSSDGSRIRGGGAGGYAFGVATVTPGTTLTVNVGQVGSFANATRGTVGAIGIEW